MRASDSRRNLNSTCSIAGEICRHGSVWDGDGLVWILVRSRLIPAGLLDCISCIDMALDTLQHGVCYILFSFITCLWHWRINSWLRRTCGIRNQIAQVSGILECYRRIGLSEWLVCFATLKLVFSVHVISQGLTSWVKNVRWILSTVRYVLLNFFFSSSFDAFWKTTTMQVAWWWNQFRYGLTLSFSDDLGISTRMKYGFLLKVRCFLFVAPSLPLTVRMP